MTGMNRNMLDLFRHSSEMEKRSHSSIFLGYVESADPNVIGWSWSRDDESDQRFNATRFQAWCNGTALVSHHKSRICHQHN